MIYTALDTFYVSEEQLKASPSRKEGVSEESEAMLRLYGCELIQESGILLRLPQAVMATGQVLFHRFYCKKSFTRFNVKRVAASCVWLAAKLEESPRKIRDVLMVFHRMECRRENYPIVMLDTTSKEYEEIKMDVIRTERHLLKEMGFICHVEHPHKFVLNYLLQLKAPVEVIQEGWNLVNDSLRTTLCVRFKSEVVACGVVYAAARRFSFPLPENPPWWLVFQAEKAEIDEVCKVLASLYKQPRAYYIDVTKDNKSFVLSKSAWDPPSNQQSIPTANGTSAAHVAVPVIVPSTEPGSPDHKNSTEKDEEPSTNGDPNVEPLIEKPNSEGGSEKKETKDEDKDRDFERKRDREDREKDRDRDRDRDRRRSDRDRDRHRDKDRERRDRDRERERERDRDHRRDSRSSRHHTSSRHRHHPYHS